MKCEIMNLKEIKNIGFIGLGVMGNPMCKNLLKNKKWRMGLLMILQALYV